MKTTTVEEVYDYLSSAIFLLAQESKNPDLRGEWKDSINKALIHARASRELLEGIKL